MRFYKKSIAKNEKVELINVNGDRTEAAALKWAKKAHFPWPIVLSDKQIESGLGQFNQRRLPGYLLIDKDGKVIAKGKDAIFKKIKTL